MTDPTPSALDVKNSRFEFIDISKEDKKYSLLGKMTTFDYYESILSPNITSKITYVDTGGGTKHDGKYDNQERIGTIYNALPIEGQGDEKITFKFSNPLGTLDFTLSQLIVIGSKNPDQESNRESVILDLISTAGSKNMEEEVKKNYHQSQTNSIAVKKIGTDILGININIDPTKNKYPFIGNKKKPFDIIMMLAAKSVPLEGNPGYFFYETRDGHNFVAIDSLINKQPVASYYRTDVNRSSTTTDTNFKMLKASIIKNQNLIDAQKAGVNSSRTVYFNPKTFKEEEVDNHMETLPNALGKSEVPTPKNKKPTRNYHRILDVGALSPNTKESKENTDPKEWQGKIQMRYNSLFAQAVDIEVPLNPVLKAGDIIECKFEMVTEGDKCDGVPDPTQSGAYMIMDLCHHYDTSNCYTSMRVVRDTYGLYTSNKSNDSEELSKRFR